MTLCDGSVKLVSRPMRDCCVRREPVVSLTVSVLAVLSSSLNCLTSALSMVMPSPVIQSDDGCWMSTMAGIIHPAPRFWVRLS